MIFLAQLKTYSRRYYQTRGTLRRLFDRVLKSDMDEDIFYAGLDACFGFVCTHAHTRIHEIADTCNTLT